MPIPLPVTLLAAQTDRRLLALVAGGHDRAFEAIVERYRRPLARYLRRVLSPALAEDVLQATFVNAWRALRGGAAVGELRPWLYRIAHNQAVNALRRAQPNGLASVELDPQLAADRGGPESEVEARDSLRQALAAIAALPERQRTALVAIAVDGRRHTELAGDLDMSEGAVRQLVYRARASLRAAVTAITPLPLVAGLASEGAVSSARVAEVAGGAGGAGLALKTGTALLAAGALVTGAPAIRDERAQRQAPATEAASAVHRARPPATASVVHTKATATPTAAPTAPRVARRAATSTRGSGSAGRRHSARRGHRQATATGASRASDTGSDERRRDRETGATSHATGPGQPAAHDGEDVAAGAGTRRRSGHVSSSGGQDSGGSADRPAALGFEPSGSGAGDDGEASLTAIPPAGDAGADGGTREAQGTGSGAGRSGSGTGDHSVDQAEPARHSG